MRFADKVLFLLLFDLLLITETGHLLSTKKNGTPTFGLASIKMYGYVDGVDERCTKNTLKADLIIKSLRSEISITYVIRRKVTEV